jgi:hypothetical protein
MSHKLAGNGSGISALAEFRLRQLKFITKVEKNYCCSKIIRQPLLKQTDVVRR